MGRHRVILEDALGRKTPREEAVTCSACIINIKVDESTAYWLYDWEAGTGNYDLPKELIVKWIGGSCILHPRVMIELIEAKLWSTYKIKATVTSFGVKQ